MILYLATQGFQVLYLTWPSQQPDGSVVQTLLFLFPAEQPERKEAKWLAQHCSTSLRQGWD